MMFDVECVHFGIADLLPDWIVTGLKDSAHRQAARGRGTTEKASSMAQVRSGTPAQLRLIWLKSRCSSGAPVSPPPLGDGVDGERWRVAGGAKTDVPLFAPFAAPYHAFLSAQCVPEYVVDR
jgi:hypothetical protein